MKNRLSTIVAAGALAVIVLAPVNYGAQNPSAIEILDRAVAAAGGTEALTGLKTLRAYSVNIRTDLGQSYSPRWDEDLSNAPREYFVTDTFVDFANGRRYWHRRQNNSNYINIMGSDWAANSTDGRTNAQSTNITDLYIHRNRHMTFPGILLTATEKKNELVRLPDATYEGRPQFVLGLTDLGKELRVFVDQKSGLVSKVEFEVSHPIKDKVTCEYRYSKWRRVGGLLLPFQTEGINTQNGTSNWTIEDMTVELNLAEGDRFAVSEAIQKQSMERITRSRTAAPQAGQIQATKLSEGVYHLIGAQNNLVVEMSDHLLVVDTPADNQRSDRVLARLKELFPAKPVRTVVFTHWHHDHSGGLRSYVASGATIYAATANRAFIERFLGTPSASAGSNSQAGGGKTQVKWLAKAETISDSSHTIEILPVANTHSDGMLAVFVRDAGILFVSDLYPSDDPKLRRAVADLAASNKLTVKTIAPSHGAAQAWEQFVKATASSN